MEFKVLNGMKYLRMIKLWGASITLAFIGLANSCGNVEKFSFASPPGMVRADLYVLRTDERPKAVLVLAPGYNGNGERMLRNPAWKAFARQHRLGLAGLSFASKMDALKESKTGYYYASQGSGKVLLDLIHQAYGKDLPILLFGISGGAHFTSRFVEWKPERVLTWCAYSAGWWDAPKRATNMPPGIVACGDADSRYGASIIYFKQGRAAGKPWLWISLDQVGHQHHPPLDDFVREYFARILSTSRAEGVWVDIDLKEQAEDATLRNQPSLTGWLPGRELFDSWKKLHTP